MGFLRREPVVAAVRGRHPAGSLRDRVGWWAPGWSDPRGPVLSSSAHHTRGPRSADRVLRVFGPRQDKDPAGLGPPHDCLSSAVQDRCFCSPEGCDLLLFPGSVPVSDGTVGDRSPRRTGPVPVSGEDRPPPRVVTVQGPGCPVPACAVRSPAIEDRSPTPSLGPRRGTRPVLLVKGRALADCPSVIQSFSIVRGSGDVVCQGP